MDIDTGQFAALTERVEQLAADVASLRSDAFVIKTLEEMSLDARYGGRWPRPAEAPRRPRHLHPVDGSAS
jgi:hypothetical protein